MSHPTVGTGLGRGEGRMTEALREATRRLGEAGVPGAAGDARRLLAHALGVRPERLPLLLGGPLPPDRGAAFRALVERRAGREPVSHLTGTRAFWGRDLLVTRDVLDPRPETETLVEHALREPFGRVLDLGTGSGCLLLTLLAERPAATGLGVDASGAALAVAAENARRLGLEARAELRPSDWWGAVEGTFDLVVSNPPYVAAGEMAGLEPEVREWEPRMALTDGGDGLGAFRAILPGAARRLAPGGRILLEIGPTQGPAVLALGREAGLLGGRIVPDLDGRDRVAAFRAS